ncbi:Predicted arabinose efflux permease, MFS family [Kroppenstedtia eburnea]|uniref:Predicted arabinose efflux permease, MFS family n=2 Tax=Kroppenstedtia eburnea TaxID=714067 RepID=A0A1N7P5X1_9BACL|nr:Predicted arabinose efflux permease, MFS family [Kroppenstedtia eburnea]
MGSEEEMQVGNLAVNMGLEAEKPAVPLLRNRRFVMVWLAGTLSGLALSVYLLTESWYVVRGLGRPEGLGWVLMATTLPRLFLMMIGGVAADRFSKTRILFWSDFTRCLLVAGMVGLLAVGGLSYGGLIIFALCFGVLDAFFWPAAQSLVPALVAKEQLTRANALVQTTQQVSMVVGPALAGFAVAYGSFTASFGLAAVFLLLASIVILFAKMEQAGSSSSRPATSPLQELREGIRYARQTRFVFIIMGISLFTNLVLAGPGQISLPVMVDQYLKGNALDLSYLESAFAGGMVLGAVWIGWLNLRRRRAVINISLISLVGVMLALFGQVSTMWQALPVLVLFGAFLSAGNILGQSMIQERVEPDKLGRVSSLLATGSMGLIPLSHGLVSIILSMGVPMPWILLVAGVMMTLFMWWVLWRVKMVWTWD